MKHLNNCITLILSLAFLMSVGACDRHSGRGRTDLQIGKDSLNQEENVNDTAKTTIIKELTKEQKDSIAKARQDSIIKAKQDSANQVVVNEIARRIKAMPDSILDNKLAEIKAQSNNAESRISEIETYLFIIVGLMVLIILLYIWLFFKLIYKTGDLYNNQTDLRTRLDRLSKDSDLNSGNQIWVNRSANISTNELQITNIIEHILKEKGVIPYQKYNSSFGSESYSPRTMDNSRTQETRNEEKTDNNKNDLGKNKTYTSSSNDSTAKNVVYLGLPINNQYFKAEEKGDSNCFVAEISKNGNSGFFNLISLDRIKSDTISSSVLNITGKVKLSDASNFETIAEGKIIKADDFWKVEVPLTILIS